MRFFTLTSLLAVLGAVVCQTADDTPDGNLTDAPYQLQWTALEKKLLTGYVRTTRPVKNDATQTVVRVLPFLQHIENVNEEEQTIRVHGYLYMEWKDEFLSWDLNEFSGLNKMTIYPYYVWTPHLMLYNSASGEELGRSVSSWMEKVWVRNDGLVTYFPTFSFEASCFFDYSDYPYDTQECPLIIGSWNYAMKDMDVQPAVEEYVHTSFAFNDTKTVVGNWRLTKVRTELRFWDALNRQRADERPSEANFGITFPELYVWIRLRRWSPYFAATVLLPAVATAAFTLAAFWTERPATGVVLAVVNILIQAVFTEDMLAKLPPSNGSPPKIVRYSAVNLILTTVACPLLIAIATVADLKDDKPVPGLARALVYVRRGLTRKLDSRRVFSRQVDREEVEEETNVESRREPVAATDTIVRWRETADCLRVVFFLFFCFVYSLSMFILLT